MVAGDYQQATAYFEWSVSAHPDPKYRFNLATSYYQQGFFDKSLEQCKLILAANPVTKLVDNTTKLSAKVHAECVAQNIVCKQ